LREGGGRVEIRSLLGANEGFALASLKSSSDARDGEREREKERERESCLAWVKRFLSQRETKHCLSLWIISVA